MPTTLPNLCRDRLFNLADGCDLVITDRPLHIGYLSGYRSILHDMASYNQLLIASRDRVVLVTGASDVCAALEALGDPELIYPYGVFYVTDLPLAHEPAATFLDAVKSAVHDVVGGSGKILLDIDNSKTLEALSAILPSDVQTQDGAAAFARARAVKLPEEISALKYAAQTTDRAIAQGAALIQPGITENEVAAEISAVMRRGGGVPRFVVVTSAERSARVDAYATDRVLLDGDIVRIDVGGTFAGYQSDMARSFVCGTMNDTAAERYKYLLSGEQAALDLVRPGVSARDIFQTAVEEVRRGPLSDYRRNHVGHGIGLSAHEFPYLTAENDVEIDTGMVLCVETPYYEYGWGGIMVEDTVVVTDKGIERFTTSTREFRDPRGTASKEH